MGSTQLGPEATSQEAPAIARAPAAPAFAFCIGEEKPSRSLTRGQTANPGCASNSLYVAMFQTRSPAHAHTPGFKSPSSTAGLFGRGIEMSVCRAVANKQAQSDLFRMAPRGKKVQDRNLCRRQEAGGVSCYTSAINKNVASSARNGTKKATAVSCCSTKASKFFIGPILPLPSKPGPS
jgi:hypothetical protein